MSRVQKPKIPDIKTTTLAEAGWTGLTTTSEKTEFNLSWLCFLYFWRFSRCRSPVSRFCATYDLNLFFFPVKPRLSSPSAPTITTSTPSARGSFVHRPVTLRAKVSLPVVAIVVSSVVVALSVIAVVTVLLLRKRQPFTEGWRVRGYRRHTLNEWDTSVSIKTWAHVLILALRFRHWDHAWADHPPPTSCPWTIQGMFLSKRQVILTRKVFFLGFICSLGKT